jgi:hypothetical protein
LSFTGMKKYGDRLTGVSAVRRVMSRSDLHVFGFMGIVSEGIQEVHARAPRDAPCICDQVCNL